MVVVYFAQKCFNAVMSNKICKYHAITNNLIFLLFWITKPVAFQPSQPNNFTVPYRFGNLIGNLQ